MNKLNRINITGWAITLLAGGLWLYGYLAAGHPPLLDWGSAPWWIADFVPNMEAEIGLALMFVGTVLTYWPGVRRPFGSAR